MRYKTVSLSKVQEGNGCMLPNRFFDMCGECSVVMRCPNKQAKRGRVQYLKTRRHKEMMKVDKTSLLLSQERRTQIYNFIKRLLRIK